jgi:hypothetical protein
VHSRLITYANLQHLNTQHRRLLQRLLQVSDVNAAKELDAGSNQRGLVRGIVTAPQRPSASFRKLIDGSDE